MVTDVDRMGRILKLLVAALDSFSGTLKSSSTSKAQIAKLKQVRAKEKLGLATSVD